MIQFRLIILFLYGFCTVVATNKNSSYYYALAEDDNYRVMRHRQLFVQDNVMFRQLDCNLGNYPIEYDYCRYNISLANTINSPHSFIYYKLSSRKNVKYIEKLKFPQRRYFQLNLTFYPEENEWYKYPIELIPNKREANLYYSKDPKKDWDIFKDPIVNTVSCQMFAYGGEYKIPVPAKKGKLIIDIFPDECLENRNRNKFTLFVNFIPDKTYELKMTQDLIRSEKIVEPIFDISFLETAQLNESSSPMENFEK